MHSVKGSLNISFHIVYSMSSIVSVPTHLYKEGSSLFCFSWLRKESCVDIDSESRARDGANFPLVSRAESRYKQTQAASTDIDSAVYFDFWLPGGFHPPVIRHILMNNELTMLSWNQTSSADIVIVGGGVGLGVYPDLAIN